MQKAININKHWISLPLLIILFLSPLGNVQNALAKVNNPGMVQDNQQTMLRQVAIFNDADTAWLYEGNWNEVQTDRAHGGQIHVSMNSGDQATISITGSSFTLVFSKSPDFGKAVIYVDGQKVKTIDQGSTRTTHQKEWTSASYGFGVHTIKIVNEQGKVINIDALRIGDIAPVNPEIPLPTNSPVPTIVLPTDMPTLAPSATPTTAFPTEIPTLAASPTAGILPTQPGEFPTLISSPNAAIVSSPTAIPAAVQESLMMAAQSAASQAPYGGIAKALPGTIQAEDYDTGGEGVSFHDTTPTNLGGKYRAAEAVDVETTSDSGGGYNIGWSKAGEWYEYTVNMTASASYSLNLRMANNVNGGSMHVEVDGVNVTGSISVPNTGGFQSWQTVTKSGISLSAGQHIIKVVFDTESANGYVGNFNSLTVNAASLPPTNTYLPPANTPFVSPTAPQVVSQAPFGGIVRALPGTIQFEDFDTGGEGISFHDTTPSNLGGKYRAAEAVDIEITSDSGGGYNTGWTKAGEWYEYTVNTTATASYTFNLRLANNANGGVMHVEVDGVNVTGSISVPNTGGFQTWQTVSKTGISLSAGQHILKIVFDTETGNGYVGNFNSLTVNAASLPPINTNLPPTNTPFVTPTAQQIISQAPYGGIIRALPGTIQIEDYDIGGEGVSFHETTPSNLGGQYRAAEAVDIETTSDSGGGYNIGWIKAGEWYEYTVNTTATASYTFNLRLANNANGGAIHVEVDGVNVTGSISVPNTGGFQTWQTVSKTGVSLTSGMHIIKIVFDTESANGYVGNFNSLTVSPASPTPSPSQVPINTPTAIAPVGNMFYVSTSGNDSNPGSQAQPWKTIQKAANSAQPGYTIIVLAGTYNERVSVSRSGSSGLPITFQAQGTSIINGFIVSADFVTIQGFEIKNPTYVRNNNEASSGIFLRGNYLIVENNYIHDSPRVGIYMGSSSTHDNTIRNNRLFRNGDSGISIAGNNHLIESNEIWETVQCHAALLAVEGNSACVHGTSLGLDADGMDFFGQGHVIRNNYIHDIRYGAGGLNPGSGDFNNDAHIDCFQTWAGSYGSASNILFAGNRCTGLDGNAGWQLQAATYLTLKNNVIESPIGVNTDSGGNHHLFIYNNIFANNRDEGIEVVNAPNSIVKNNILYNQGGQSIIFFGDKTGVEIDYNLGFNSSGSLRCIVVEGWGCLSPVPVHNLWNVDPKLISPATGDYRPQAGSPACSGGSDGTYIGAFSCTP